jgi:hypothetical protein
LGLFARPCVQGLTDTSNDIAAPEVFVFVAAEALNSLEIMS